MSEVAVRDEAAEEHDATEGGARRRTVARAERSSFAKRMGQLVVSKGIRQADLARRTELTPALISSYMLGKAIPGKLNAIKIAKALGVTPETLLPEPADDADSYSGNSPMALVVNPEDPSMAVLRINMKVRFETGSEIIRLLIKDRQAQGELGQTG